MRAPADQLPAAGGAAPTLRLAGDTGGREQARPAADAERRAAALIEEARRAAQAGGDPGSAVPLLSEALRLLSGAGAVPSDLWIGASGLLARLDLDAGRAAAARARAEEFMRVARPTEWRARAAASAADIRFRLGDFADAATLLEEALAVDPGTLSQVYGDLFVAYAAAQEAAEAEGRIDDAAALIDARLAILRTFAVDPDDAGKRALLFGKFYLFHEATRYGAAAAALRAWAAAGQPTPDERAFIDRMASLTLDYARLSGEVERRSVQLDYAELSVAFAELAGDPSDPRLGWALRERAAAEKGLGRIDASTQSLRQAAEVLARSGAGRAELHFVLCDLAANAWAGGDLTLARDLYARADASRAAAQAEGAPADAPLDRAIEAVNRANLEVDLGDGAKALDLAGQARALFAEDAARGPQKWNARAVAARIDAVRARALAATGRRAEAVAAALAAAGTARAVYPVDHPDLALALVNAGDLVAALGDTGRGIPLMQEGAGRLARALPPDAPQVLEAEGKLALVQLTAGNRPAALALLRRITEARKSPAYREALPEAAFEFETLAWLLLADRPADDTERLDEAFEALQWTQITRSAEALSLLEARLAASDAGLAPILRRRQDLIEEHRRTTSRVLAALAGGGTAPGAVAGMNARLAEIDADLGRIDADIAALGLEMTGLAAVRPLGIAGVQALLKPGEGLVTFALPGLRPDRVPGLGRSSNRAILVTRDRVAVGTVDEPGRRALDDRLRAFRCSVAISDAGCRRPLAAELRGAMIAGGVGDARSYFDFEAAYRLYRDLFGGLSGALDGLDHLIVVPPADMLPLPFAALVTSPGEPQRLGAADWLVRRHALSVLPSVPSLRTLRSFAPGVPGGRYLGVGDPLVGAGRPVDCAAIAATALRARPGDRPVLAAGPEGGLRLADPGALRGLPRLPDTACEVEAIGRLFPPGGADILLGAGAREAAIKRLAADGALSGYDAIVFATHGLTASETGAASPGLVLTPPERATEEDDGLLTAGEIATFELSARLVMLSACNTAAGEGQGADGLSGMARAFFHAGARAVVVTQWSVYSDAALQVSTGLLSELERRAGDGAAKALRRTQLGILDDPRAAAFRQHPAYWAPFTLVGAD